MLALVLMLVGGIVATGVVQAQETTVTPPSLVNANVKVAIDGDATADADDNC